VTDGPGEVDAVHPDVAGEAHVEQVADRLPPQVGPQGFAQRQVWERTHRLAELAAEYRIDIIGPPGIPA
jgi:hypothetical protein